MRISNFTCYLQIIKRNRKFFIKKNPFIQKKLTWIRTNDSFFLRVFQVISLPIKLTDLGPILLGLDTKVCYIVFHYFSSSSLFSLLINGSFSFLKQNHLSFLSFNISLSDPQNSIFSFNCLSLSLNSYQTTSKPN